MSQPRVRDRGYDLCVCVEYAEGSMIGLVRLRHDVVALVADDGGGDVTMAEARGHVRAVLVSPRSLRALVLVALLAFCLAVPIAAFAAPPAAPVLEQPSRLGYLEHPVKGWAVFLNWNDVADATSYEVYNGDTNALIDTSASSTYVFTALPAGVYRYYIVALNAGAERSDPSNTITVTFVAGAPANPAPSGMLLVPNSNYQVSVTGATSIPASITIPYDPAEVTGDPADLKLLHWNGTAWEDITQTVNTASNTISGTTSSFSDFSAAELGPGDPATSTPASSTWVIALLALAGLGIAGVSLTRAGRHA